jgi:hypothetical protein
VTRKIAPTTEADVQLTIDELVLDGWPLGDRDRIADAFRRKLTSLLARQVPRLLQAGAAACEELDAGTFSAGRRPESVGEAVALRVYEALERNDASQRSGRPSP